MQVQDSQSNVLIIGAGPTGLILATVLTRYGVKVRLIERKTALSKHTKATNLMQRTQELLNALGLLEPLQEVGGQMSKLMVHAYGKCFGPRTMHLQETPFQDVILCGQHNFEKIAAENLKALGVSIEFDTELILLRQEAKSVFATTQKQGTVQENQYSYVIGCDGATGISRSFTRYNFTPVKTGVGIRQIDAKLQWRRSSTMNQMWLFYFDNGFAVVVPLPGNVHRLLTIEPKAAFPAREPTLDEMQTRMREVTGDNSLTLADPEWFSYTDLSMGLAPQFRDKRIFLAGDVANPVLPNGGQGMNTGIGDAFNLGWKLAAVLMHQAPDALLDTFNEERHALRNMLQKAQFNSLKYTTLSTPKSMQSAFRLFAEPLLNLGGEYALAETFSQLKQSTTKSSLTLDKLSSGGVKAGDRVPDATVVHEFSSVNLFDFLYRGNWTLLIFSGRAKPLNPSWIQALKDLQRTDLKSYWVAADSTIDGADVLFDLDEEAHRAYGVVDPTGYLVRPDGYVAVKFGAGDFGILKAYLKHWLPDATQSFSKLVSNSFTRVSC